MISQVCNNSGSSIKSNQTQTGRSKSRTQLGTSQTAEVYIRLIRHSTIMVKFLSSKNKLPFLEPIENPCKVIIKRFKEKRTKILKQSMSKLKKIPDAEQCLRQAVLIRNTFIRAKDLSPRQFERQLLTQSTDNLDIYHSDLLQDLENKNNNMSEKSKDCASSYSNQTPLHSDHLNQTYPSSDCGNEYKVTSAAVDSRQLVAVS